VLPYRAISCQAFGSKRRLPIGKVLNVPASNSRTIKCPSSARNISTVIIPRYRDSTRLLVLVSAEKNVANAKPICMPQMSPVISTTARVTRMTMPSAMPISTCSTITPSPGQENSATWGNGGRFGASRNASNIASPTLTWFDTFLCPRIGSLIRYASTRQNGQKKPVSHSCSCAELTSITARQPISVGRLVNSARV